MLKDKNGIELKVGQVVKVEGSFFKVDNGYFRITHSPENENWTGLSYCLKKVNKKNFLDSNGKRSLAFYPPMITVNNRERRIEAMEHNKANVTIEIIASVKIFKVKEIDIIKNNHFFYYFTKEEFFEYITRSESIQFIENPDLENLRGFMFKLNKKYKFELLEILN